MPMKVAKVGHLVLKVRSLEKSLAFYCGVLGLKEVARADFGQGPMVFLSTGDSHHDIALAERDGGESGAGSSPLDHFALKVGDSLDELAAAKNDLEGAGVPIHIVLDHT